MNPLDARRRLLGRNVYKKTVEGNPAIAQGSLARRYPGITMQGWTEQAQYEGKNLFDVGSVESNSILQSNGNTIKNNDYDTSGFVKVLPGAVYRRTVVGGSGNYYYTADKTFLNNDVNGQVVNVPENAEYLRFSLYTGRGAEIMLNEGNTLLPYEPYTGGAPSPSPDYPQEIVSAGKYDEASRKYEYEMKLTGANLFDISKVITNSGFLTNNGDGTLTATPGSGDSAVSGKAPRTLRDYCPELISGKTYRLSANSTGIAKQIYLLGANNIWAYGRPRTITDADLESEVFFYASGVNTEAVISDIMITEVEDADYEPYRTPQTVTLTADRPLTKWDRLEKRAGQWGWVYKSAEIVLDGSEVWGVYGSGFYTSSALLETYTRTHGVCEQGNIKAYDSTDGVYGPNSIWLCVKNSNIYWNENPYFNAELEDSGIGNWKNHLSQNPAVIWYETTEETFIPLSESEQEQMNELYTFRPTTVLSNDCECEMTLTYKTKKSLEVTD